MRRRYSSLQGIRWEMFFFNIVVTGVANVVFTFVAIYTVERLGRRALMLFGAGGWLAFISFSALAISSR